MHLCSNCNRRTTNVLMMMMMMMKSSPVVVLLITSLLDVHPSCHTTVSVTWKIDVYFINFALSVKIRNNNRYSDVVSPVQFGLYDLNAPIGLHVYGIEVQFSYCSVNEA